ncbi:MAG: hypothetical protein K2X82_15465 [Gemmataceae bacterium]|nr:hypothetical protein [Gemmataceae bacterium]
MTSARLYLAAAAAALGLAGTAAANGPNWGRHGCNGPFCNNANYPRFHGSWRSTLFTGQQPLPTFQAAPWYLYWPYDGHFLTPAPVTGAFYGPPGAGNFPVNPYFPAPAGPYGPIPGGPPPMPGQSPAAPTGALPLAPAGPAPVGPAGYNLR